MKQAIYILLFAIIASSLLLAGCGSTTPTTAPAQTTTAAVTTTAAAQTTTSAPKTTSAPNTTTAAATTAAGIQPVKGGVLKIICGGNSKPLGWPPDVVGNDEMYTWPMEEALWFRDEKGTLQPWLATSWDTPADWSSITFHLRKDVKFQDGTDFNAAAVKWMLDQHKAAKLTGSDAWGEISVVDDYTVKMNITTFQNTVPQVIGQVKFVSPTAYQKNGLDWMKANPVGTGSFKLKEYKQSVSLELERNPNYWGTQPYLDGIKYLYITDATTKKSAFVAGDAQVAYYAITDPQAISELTGMNKGYSYDITPVANVYIYFDQGNPDFSLNQNSMFKDVLVRQAVEYAINRDKIASTIGKGFWKPLYQWAQPSLYSYNSSITPREYNPAKAKELLAEAGYPNGFSTVFYATTSTDPSYCDAIQSYLGAVGINTKVNMITGAVNSQLMSVTGWTGMMNGNCGVWGGEVLERMQFHYGGNQNLSIYRSPEFLALLKSGLAQTDMAKRDQMAQQIEKYIYDNAMMVPVYTQGPTIVTVKGTHDLQFMKSRTTYWWTYNTAWLEKSAQ